MNALSLIPWWAKLLAIVAVIAALYGGYRAWRHAVWTEGKNAAIEAVQAQNGIAADAARKVDQAIDDCYDRGGTWDVSTGACLQ